MRGVQVGAGERFARDFLENVISQVRGVRLYGEPLAAHTSLQVGGPADVLVFPHSELDFELLARRCREAEVPLFVFGAGTNLLVRDGGVRGVAACLLGSLDSVRAVAKEDGMVRLEAGAGAPLSRVVRLSVDQELEGLEWAVGIPGTVGGALAMNAGAADGCIGQVVTELRIVDKRGDIGVKPAESFTFGYRCSSLREHGTVLGVAMQLRRGDGLKIAHRVERVLAHRRRTQPLGARSAGCMFKNPPGGHAARLIEAAGFKGKRVGGACVSSLHANFICNVGEATARDILTVMDEIRDRVLEMAGVLLEDEVVVVGEEV